MTDQTNDVYELTETAPTAKPSLVKTLAKEFLFAGGRAAVTTSHIGFGVMAGTLSASAFGLAGEFINSALTTPGNAGAAYAAGVAFNAPFIHHIFNGGLSERLTGEANPNGAFTKATKATAYTAGAIGALLAAAAALAPAPDGGIPARGLDQYFERSPRQTHEAKRKITIVQNANGPAVTLG
jgi:hypothetical protein